MEFRRAYKFRLYPTEGQKEMLDKTFGACRYVYNYYLDMQISAYSSAGISVPYTQLSKDLTQLRKQTEWMSGVEFVPLQQSLRALMTAYSSFFQKKSLLPKHKTKRSSQSFKKPTNWSLKGNKLQISRGFIVKCRGQMPTGVSAMNTLTVSKSSTGKYYASITCVGTKETPNLDGSIGVDLGLNDLAITSNGDKYARPKLAQANAKRLKRLQQNLNRKQEGSKNRQKARLAVARLHEKASNQRSDNLHKTSHAIVSGDYKLIAVEDLSVANMMKNRRLSRSIGDTGWGELIRQIEYKQAWRGGRTVKVDRFFPSSKQCSSCSVVIAKLPLSVRHWQCENCGAKHDRDVNAAKNILKQAEVQLGVESTEGSLSADVTGSMKRRQVLPDAETTNTSTKDTI